MRTRTYSAGEPVSFRYVTAMVKVVAVVPEFGE
jgi:hypothetical protein